ncbi:MAG: hypothetical protein JSW03_02990 [Candidatus Eiseniibacteriota bacterium]|nr:MAG: hypothetical protein JSW03_02990 [Candidatus Eisenbacteria bacterium]
MKASLLLICSVYILSILWASPLCSQELPPLSGEVKIGACTITEDGSPASIMESYNVSKGLTLDKLFLIGRLGATSTVFVDVNNVTRNQRNLRLEFMGTRVFNIRLDHTRMRNLIQGAGSPEFKREFTGVSGSVTPNKWLKMYGGVTSQEKSGDRVALLSDGADFIGTRYDYSIRARNVGAQLRRDGQSIDLNYEWRAFESKSSRFLNRDGQRLRVSIHLPITRKLRFSGSYLTDKGALKDTEAALLVRSYSGTLTALPVKRLKLSGYIDYRDADNDVTDICSSALKVGGRGTVDLYPVVTTELGYEYTIREDGPRSESEDAEREVTSNALIVGLRAKPSDKTRVTLRYRTRRADRGDYVDLTGPSDVDNFLARLESWPTSNLRLAVGFEDKDRSNDELLTSGRIRGINGYADFEHEDFGYRPNLRLSASLSRSEFEDPETSFITDNVLVTARLRLALSPVITVETGITHIEIREDLDIRKDIALAAIGFEFMPGYVMEVRYDLFNHDDFMNYRDNFVANVFTLSLSRKFGLGGTSD